MTSRPSFEDWLAFPTRVTHFSEAAASGKIKVGDSTVFCDRSMLAEAAKLLTAAGDKIAAMHRDIIKGAMRNLVKNSFPFLKHEIFEERFEYDLSNVRTGIGKSGEELAQFARVMNVLRNAALAFVESPTPSNKAALDTMAETIRKMNRDDVAEYFSQSFFSWARPSNHASDAFKKAFSKFKVDATGPNGKQMLDDIKSLVRRAFAGIDIAAAHLAELAKKLDAGPENKVYVSSWVLGAFRGEQTVSSIIEARAHGYSDSDIDARIDDANVESTTQLGSGAFNTVTLIKLKDGSEWVFKPEMPGCLTSGFSSHFHGAAAVHAEFEVDRKGERVGEQIPGASHKRPGSHDRQRWFGRNRPGEDLQQAACPGVVTHLRHQELRRAGRDGQRFLLQTRGARAGRP